MRMGGRRRRRDSETLRVALSPQDVAHAELDALRQELLARTQAEGTVITAALTAIAAIGGFALAKKEGRLEMLLVLPVVLSGLGLLLVNAVTANYRIAEYIREDLWPRLPPQPPASEFPSWEHYLVKYRATDPVRRALSGASSFALIFVAPGVAALGITWHVVDGSLWFLWGTGAASIAALMLLARGLTKQGPLVQRNTDRRD